MDRAKRAVGHAEAAQPLLAVHRLHHGLGVDDERILPVLADDWRVLVHRAPDGQGHGAQGGMQEAGEGASPAAALTRANRSG